MYECLYEDADSPAARLYECWPGDYQYYYNALHEEIDQSIDALPAAIPRPLLRQALHAAGCTADLQQCEIAEELGVELPPMSTAVEPG